MNNKSHILQWALLVIGLLYCSAFSTATAQTPGLVDSTMLNIKLKALDLQKNNIQQQIKTADSKRAQTIVGVSPSTMEKINTQQDSICLELRSQLCAVELEISELTTHKNTTVVQRVGNQIQKLSEQISK